MHEAQMHPCAQMLTLTYDNENLPDFPHSILIEDHQTFIKALRYHADPIKIRYFNSNEYGEPTQENNYIARPHMHTIIFGYEFTDLELIKITPQGEIFTSNTLAHVWKKGHVSIIELTIDVANYVAKYVIKKVGGDKADEHYKRIDLATGEIANVRPEFANMSRRPGIAHKWLEKYQTDIYPSDQTILKGGIQVKTPTYYDNLLKESDPEMLEQIKIRRMDFANKHRKDSTQRRLLTRELCTKAKITKRELNL